MVGSDSPTQPEQALRQVPSSTSFSNLSIYSGPQDHARPHTPDPYLKPLKPALKHAYSHDSARTTFTFGSTTAAPSYPFSVLSSASLADNGKRHPASPETSRPSSPAPLFSQQLAAAVTAAIGSAEVDSRVETQALFLQQQKLHQPQPRQAQPFVEAIIPPTPIQERAPAEVSFASDTTADTHSAQPASLAIPSPSSTSISGSASASASQPQRRASLDEQPFSAPIAKMASSSSDSGVERKPKHQHLHHYHFWHLGYHHHHDRDKEANHPASLLSSGSNTGSANTPVSAPPGTPAHTLDGVNEVTSMASASASGSGSGSRTGTGGGAGLSANLGPIVASRVPPKGWERKVGFDTMPDAMETESQSFSFTLQARSKGYVRTKNTRTFMCAVDNNTYSERALEWLMESLVEDGDEVVALRVLEGEADTIDQDEAREDANELMAQVVDLNEEILGRRISIVIEFIAGRPTSTIMRLIHMYRPDSLTIGTRGKSANALQKMLSGGSLSIGHVSRDLLSRSPVPVVVVRPEAKVQKHLKKRLNDPARRGYHDLIKGSGFDLQALPMSVSKSKRESLHLHHHGSSRRSVNTSSSTFGSSAEKSKGRHHRKTTSSSSLSNVAGTAKGITGDVGLSSARSSIDADHLSSQFAKPDASTSDAINADASANAGGSADALAPVPSRSSQHSSDSHWLRVDEEGNCYTSDGSAGTSAAGKEVETALRVAGAGTRARAGDSAGVH